VRDRGEMTMTDACAQRTFLHCFCRREHSSRTLVDDVKNRTPRKRRRRRSSGQESTGNGDDEGDEDGADEQDGVDGVPGSAQGSAQPSSLRRL